MVTATGNSHPLIGARVLNVHRQSCDYPLAYRLAHHGTVAAVDGCLVRVLFDGQDHSSWMAPQDLAHCDRWPSDGCRISI